MAKKRLLTKEIEEVKPKAEGIKVNKQGKAYVPNQALYDEIIKSKEQDKLTDAAVEMFQLMVENIQRKCYYKDPEEKKDCAATALMDLILYWRAFNPEKSSNPFAFYTSVITNGLAKGWDKLHPTNRKCPDARFTSLDNNIYNL